MFIDILHFPSPDNQIRRKAGKDASQIREDLKKKEADKEAALKRAEKLEEQRAKERVRQQIEADKRERAEKARLDKLRREGKTEQVSPAGAGAPSVAQTAARPAAGSNSKESRLRVRLNTGDMWNGSFDADGTTLRDVEQKVIADGKSAGPKLKVSRLFLPHSSSQSARTNRPSQRLARNERFATHRGWR